MYLPCVYSLHQKLTLVLGMSMLMSDFVNGIHLWNFNADSVVHVHVVCKNF